MVNKNEEEKYPKKVKRNLCKQEELVGL